MKPPRSFILAAVTAALLSSGPVAQQTVRAELPNFDIRTQKSQAASEYVTRVAADAAPAAVLADRTSIRTANVAQLRAEFADIDVQENEALGVPEVVSVKPGAGFLTGPSIDRVDTMRAFLSVHAGAFGLSTTQVSDLVLVSNYVNPAGNMAWVEFEQQINGIPVFQGLIRGGFTAQGELARTTGLLAADLEAAALRSVAAISATQAVAHAAQSVGWVQTANALVERGTTAGKITISRGSMARDARAWRVYFPIAPGVARLSWVTEIWGDPDVFMIVLDAEDGTILFRKNLTNAQTHSATYFVYASDSPAPLSPTNVLPGSGTQAPADVRTQFSLIGNEPPYGFNNYGWIENGVNAGHGWTEGNNVRAGVDLIAPDGIDTVTLGTNRVFNFAYDPATDATSTANYRNGEVTNQFYWANVYHDKLYLLGFTEVARNFQQNNFLRGGLQNDRVEAEAQDYSGVNNANFATPADGAPGRMQMYIFNTIPTRSSGLDQTVILHELTHGTSQRLHNNASGLNTIMASGMGEGWSDFYARALLSSAGEDVNGIYPMGAWITHQLAVGYTNNYYYGIRRFPYAVKTNLGSNGKPHNPLTFADVDQTQYDVSDGAYPVGTIAPSGAFQVHNLGEIWCSALLEVRARFIARLGWATGNQKILQFVTDAMKLDPATPTFLEGRDSIILAAQAGGGTAEDIADVWEGFAARGMGVGAQVLNALTGSVIESFDVPGTTQGAGSLTFESMPNGWIDPGEEVSVSLCIGNNGANASASVLGTLQGIGGVTLPTAPQSYGVIPGNSTVCKPFSFTSGAACGNAVQATLAVTDGITSKNFVYVFPVGGPIFGVFDENFDSATPPALPVRWSTATLAGAANLWVTEASLPDSAPNRARVNDPNVLSDNVLISPGINIPAVGAVMSFRHRYQTEDGYDGGVLEIQIESGAWADIVTAGGSFSAGGYSKTINSNFQSPIAGRQAWSGNSGAYITTTVNLPHASAGHTVKLRWRMASDTSVGSQSWAIDTIVIDSAAGICGGPEVPDPFNKSQPGDGAMAQPLSPVLSWETAAGATNYQYCIDTSNDNTCNSSWISVGNTTSVALSGLPATTTHYWHVRAVNATGTRYAQTDLGAYWAFTTGVQSLPFGQVDTPSQNAAGVQGAIGVTGWALDDIGVAKVEIFRNCLGFEPGNCQTLLGQSVVYIGDAAFLPGARPDVAAAFPTYPQNHVAGWGYLMLTPMLPHVTNSQPYGGVGTLTLYAIATDSNGGKRLLGRSSVPGSPDYATPTSITMTNDTIAKPFGAIDTPGQGQTIGGIFNNFGWAITPDSNSTSGDALDILIPVNGATMTVFIDAQPVALVLYNQCRGTVGNPVPGGLFCDDDVSNIFGNPAPQAPLTTRLSNPTKFRNLDAGRAAIGAYTFDTTTLSNGLHTIAWSVTDSFGRNEGIGSRFFIVSNGALAFAAETEVKTTAHVAGFVRGTGRVWSRTGFDLAEPWKAMEAKDDGTYAVQVPELGRLELWLGEAIEAAYMVANGHLHALPVGSMLKGPQFGWMPPAGYIGPYELVFVRGNERVSVTVTIVERSRVGK